MKADRTIAILALVGPAILASIGGACTRDGDAATARPAYVDSVIPRDRALLRFRQGLPEVTALTGGAESREALVRAFVVALERQDTVALGRMVISPSEFAYLYYPTTPQSLPPYDLSPALMWFTLEGRSHQDLPKALAAFGGRDFRYLDHQCAEPPRTEGENRVWGYCLLRGVVGTDTLPERLFGLIVERGGRFKFVSFANKL